MDLGLYNITPREFKILERNEGENITYELEPVSEPEVCPVCGFSDMKQRGTYNRKVRDLSEYAKKVGLIIHSHRYFCKNCHSTWVPKFDSINDKARMTNRMREYIRKESLKVPFSRIKDDLDITVPTIRSIFMDYVAELDKNHKIVAPRVLGMDENYLNNHYRCIYTDVENGLVIDLSSDRYLPTVRSWIARLPEKERIECVTIDMWGPYQDAVTAELPNVPIIIDKFHVIKNVTGALDAFRKAFRDDLSSAQKKELKNSRWLLLQNKEDLDKDDAKKFRLQILFGCHPELEEPYLLKEEFRNIYRESKDRKEAEQRYKDWKKKAAGCKAYADVINMVDNWYTEIFNYFDYGYTNAVTEALNSVCKTIAAQGRGYAFEVLRAKILYGTKASKPAKFHYYTKEKPASNLQTFEEYIEYKGGMYAFTGAVSDFIPNINTYSKRYKHIDVSAGTDIRLLQYYLSLSNLWKIPPK